MSGIMTTGSLANLMPHVIKTIDTNQAKLMKNGEYNNFIEEGTTSSETMEFHERENTGGAQFIAEGARPPMEDLKDGWKKKLGVVYVGLVGGYTQAMMKFRLKDASARVTKMLQSSYPILLEDLIAMYFELADQTRATVTKINGVPIIDPQCITGKSLAATGHGWKSSSGYTYDTLADAFVAPDADTLWDKINEIESRRDNAGNLLNYRVKKIVYGMSNRQQIVKILKSTEDPETANRSVNTIRDQLGPESGLLYRRMISQDEWALQTDAPKPIILNTGWKPQIRQKEDELTGNFFLAMNACFMHGAMEPSMYFIKHLS